MNEIIESPALGLAPAAATTSTVPPAKPVAFKKPRTQRPSYLLPSAVLVRFRTFTVSLREYRTRNKE
jgi:hypothetical protein